MENGAFFVYQEESFTCKFTINKPQTSYLILKQITYATSAEKLQRLKGNMVEDPNMQSTG